MPKCKPHRPLEPGIQRYPGSTCKNQGIGSRQGHRLLYGRYRQARVRQRVYKDCVHLPPFPVLPLIALEEPPGRQFQNHCLPRFILSFRECQGKKKGKELWVLGIECLLEIWSCTRHGCSLCGLCRALAALCGDKCFSHFKSEKA